MKKNIVIPVMAILVLAMGTTAMARGGYHGEFNRGQDQIFDQLTPEKQIEVKAIFKKFEDKFEAHKSQMWAKRTELNALVASGTADKKTITTLVSEMSTLRTQGYNLRKQLSEEIEQATGIAMPVRGFGGYGKDNGRQDRSYHRQNNRNGGSCWGYNS